MFRLVCVCQLVSLALELLLVAPSINQHSLLTSCSGQQPSPDPPQSLRCEGGSEGGRRGREGVKVDKREGGSEGGQEGGRE